MFEGLDNLLSHGLLRRVSRQNHIVETSVSTRYSVVVLSSGSDGKVQCLQSSQGTPVTSCGEEQELFLLMVVKLLKDLPEPLDVLVSGLDAHISS